MGSIEKAGAGRAGSGKKKTLEALGQWGRSKKRARDERDLVKKKHRRPSVSGVDRKSGRGTNGIS